jgi:hypothetical protein
LAPNNTISSLNNITFSGIGNQISQDSNSFQKIQKLSKTNLSHTNIEMGNNRGVFTKVNDLYQGPSVLNTSTHEYGNPRQHNLTSLGATLPSFITLVDEKSFSRFFNYTLNTSGGPKTGVQTQPLVLKQGQGSLFFSDSYRSTMQKLFLSLESDNMNFFFLKWGSHF